MAIGNPHVYNNIIWLHYILYELFGGSTCVYRWKELKTKRRKLEIRNSIWLCPRQILLYCKTGTVSIRRKLFSTANFQFWCRLLLRFFYYYYFYYFSVGLLLFIFFNHSNFFFCSPVELNSNHTTPPYTSTGRNVSRAH